MNAEPQRLEGEIRRQRFEGIEQVQAPLGGHHPLRQRIDGGWQAAAPEMHARDQAALGIEGLEFEIVDDDRGAARVREENVEVQPPSARIGLCMHDLGHDLEQLERPVRTVRAKK